MAAQSGIGLTRVLLLLGLSASYPFVAKKEKISEILNDLQETFNSGNVFGDVHEDLNEMVHLLATEVRNMACTRSISILKTNSGNGDIMYVTKHNMEGAVSKMKKTWRLFHLLFPQSVRNHLTQQIQNLDDKVEEQKEISKEIGNEQGEIRDQNRLQGFACTGVQFLCESVGTQTGRMPDFMQDISKTLNKCGYFLEFKSLKGLLHLTDVMESGITDPPRLDATKKIEIDSDATKKIEIDSLDKPHALTRGATIRYTNPSPH